MRCSRKSSAHAPRSSASKPLAPPPTPFSSARTRNPPLTRFDLTTAGGRWRTTAHHLWHDHAYLRLAFSNAHWISDELVRTNQPWPFQLKAWAERGIRTVINLRGGFETSF